MPVIFQLADDELIASMKSIMKRYHPLLHEHEVRVDLLLAFAIGDCNAITVAGYPAAAKVRVVKLSDRTKGCGDAEIQVDGDRMKKWSKRKLQAILDHELTHLELKRDRDGKFKRDDLDRPMLTMRKHDRHFGWFDVVANRWGKDSAEGEQMRDMVEDAEFVQMYLPGFDPWTDFGSKNREKRNASIEE